MQSNGISNGNGIHNGLNGSAKPSHIPTDDNWSKAMVVLGSQWGDEGKGKVVDTLAIDADIVCRCQVLIVNNLIYSFLFVRSIPY